MFLWRWRSNGLFVLKFERCEHRDDISIVYQQSIVFNNDYFGCISVMKKRWGFSSCRLDCARLGQPWSDRLSGICCIWSQRWLFGCASCCAQCYIFEDISPQLLWGTSRWCHTSKICLGLCLPRCEHQCLHSSVAISGHLCSSVLEHLSSYCQTSIPQKHSFG